MWSRVCSWFWHGSSWLSSRAPPALGLCRRMAAWWWLGLARLRNWRQLSTRELFDSLALSAFTLAVCFLLVLVVLGLLGCTTLGQGFRAFASFVAIVAALFTIYGLRWAAIRFEEASIKPEVELIATEVRRVNAREPQWHARPIRRQDPPTVTGQREQRGFRKDYRVEAALFLQNHAPRAARYVHLLIWLDVSHDPRHCCFNYAFGGPRQDREPIHAQRANDEEEPCLSIRLSSDLVVYEQPVAIGRLDLIWENLPHPISDLRLRYEVQTLDSTSKGSLALKINWRPIRRPS